jgi:ribosomal protein S18 acetylase RimI-like enzyme
MAIACVDWRDADSDDLAAIYAGEIHRWSTVLGWETAASWEQIELGRRLGTVPGLLARDSSGALVGWTFYLLHRDVLQIGGLAAVSETATRALVDGIFASETARRARSITLFVFTDAPGLTSVLSRRGLSVRGYDYLMKPLPDRLPTSMRDSVAIAREVPPGLRRWRPGDAPAIAALLAAAYPGEDEVRPFAPDGTEAEWTEYVGQLVGASGCGTIMPSGCYVAPAGPDRVIGVVLVTHLAEATAHIAQLAVDPQAQRAGLGRVLVNAACGAASDARCDRMTLLVEGGNVAARRLYDASGFRGVAGFVSAGCGQPMRLISVGLGRVTDSRP